MSGIGLDLLEASLVGASLSACLVEPGVEDLVLCKGRSLEIYRLDGDTLRLHGIHPFGAQIRAVERIRAAGPAPTHHHLLLHFDRCKASVLRYSRKIGGFVTVSMHSFENEQQTLALPDYDLTSCVSLGAHQRVSAVPADGRCALVRLNSGNWAVLPFSVSEDEAMSRDSVVFGSKRISERLACAHVLDFVFLDGFFEPTVAVLYESGSPNWPAQLAVRRDTVEIVVATVSLNAGLNADGVAFTQIFHRSGLPSECRRFVALPKPTGGLLCCGPNVLVHVDPAGSSGLAVCPLNGFGHMSSPQLVMPTVLTLTASSNVVALPGGTAVLWSTREGVWHWLRIARGAHGVASMSVESVGQDGLCCPAGYTVLPNGLLFTASLNGAHQLFRLPPSFLPERSGGGPMTDDLYGDEDDLYGTSKGESAPAPGDLLELLAEIPSLGPVSDFTLAPTDGDGGHFEIVTAGSHGGTGHVTRVLTTVPLSESASIELAGGESVHALSKGLVVVSTSDRSCVFSTAGGTLTRTADSAAQLDAPTTLAYALDDGRVVQVTEVGYRLLTAETLAVLSEVGLGGDIVEARNVGTLLILRSRKGALLLVDVPSGQQIRLDVSAEQISACAHGERSVIAALLADGSLAIYEVNHSAGCQLVFRSECLGFLPQVLMPNGSVPAGITERFAVDFVQVLCKGPTSELFLAVGTGGDTLTLYRLCANAFVKMFSESLELRGVCTPFADGASCGFFIGGSALVFLGSLEYPRVHRFRKPLKAVAGLEAGRFIGVDADGTTISILSLPRGLVLDAPLPFRAHRVPGQVHRVVPCPGAPGCLALVTSQPVPGGFKLPDDEYSAVADNREWKAPANLPDQSILPPPAARKYSLSLVSVDEASEDVVLVGEHALEEYELPVELQISNLHTKETSSGKKSFIVLGVVAARGEDRPVRSRILVFSTVQLVPEPGQPASSGLRLKLLVAHELKTGASALCPIAGHLAVTTGYKTIVHEFEDNDQLTGVAFVDSGVHQIAAAAVKNFLWLGDVSGRGLGLYAFQEKPPKLVELGRLVDPEESAHPILAVGCMVSSSGQMAAVAVNDSGRLSFFSYAPASLASAGGTRLHHDGAFDTGARILNLIPVALPDGSIALVHMSAEGSIGLVASFSDASDYYRLLAEAQAKMISELPHPAGLHPRAARGVPANRHIIDGALFTRRFVALPRLTQGGIASDPGSVRRALADIYDLVHARIV